MKQILPYILGAFLFVLVSLLASRVMAAGLTLDKIGTTNFTSGASTWTYNGSNPVFEGTATAAATVNLNLDGALEASTTAATDGNWSITPTSLDTNGDYQVQLSSGEDSIAFTLTIASASATTSSTTSTSSAMPETLPKTGSEDVIFLLSIGGIMMAAGISSHLLLRKQ